MPVDNKKLSLKFSLLVGIVSICAVCAYIAWTFCVQDGFAREKALVEARALNLEMHASWDYIDASQDAINYNSDGAYDFKKIYCSIAGKNIAQRFTNQADGYEIRFARENPRSGADKPDAFEQAAIDAFRASPVTEYYDITDYNGAPAFRYAAALEIKDNCLTCHGDPAGEKDEVGYFKEGMALGDLAGITSIVVPLDVYNDEARIRIVQGAIFFLVLGLVTIFVVRFALNRWVVGPLNATNEYLRNENEAQQNFLAIMSHELRTPLSSIIAFTDLWNSGGKNRGAEEQQLVNEIKENSRALLDLVNNTIDTAKLEAGEFVLSYDEVDPVDVIQSVTTTLGPLAHKNGVRIEKHISSCTPIIVSDEAALRKIFANIIGNAVKYSPEGGVVEIRTAFVGESIEVSVADEGPGIPFDQQECIFDRFKRIECEQTERSVSGSGLGLYLAKSLAERLGGTIVLVSIPGKGSAFSVILPIDSSHF